MYDVSKAELTQLTMVEETAYNTSNLFIDSTDCPSSPVQEANDFRSTASEDHHYLGSLKPLLAYIK